MKVEISSQVVDFLRRLPPEPRHKLRRAVKALTKESGDIKRRLHGKAILTRVAALPAAGGPAAGHSRRHDPAWVYAPDAIVAAVGDIKTPVKTQGGEDGAAELR